MKSLLYKSISLVLITFPCFANEIYVNQVGDNTNVNITQDGENNQIEGLSGTGDATLSGNNKTVTFSQTGDTNQIRVWTHGGNQQMSLTQDGNNNIRNLDNHGNNNNISVNIINAKYRYLDYIVLIKRENIFKTEYFFRQI